MSVTALRGLALAVILAAGTLGLTGASRADDSINQANDSMIQQRQMDYFGQRGGYVLIQDQTAQSVGGRSANIVAPAGQIFVTTIPVGPGPAYAAPVYVAPAYVAPVYAAPVFIAPYGPAAYGAPGHAIPGYGIPGYPPYYR